MERNPFCVRSAGIHTGLSIIPDKQESITVTAPQLIYSGNRGNQPMLTVI
jgi:hypothetical protein